MSALFDMIRQKLNQRPAQEESPLHPPTPTPTPKNEEDQWSDASSDGSYQSAHGVQVDGGRDTYRSSEEDAARFLPYMPSLFSKDLPPCGLDPQVAYENVNERLRKCWLHFRGEKSVAEVCQVVKDDLDNQKYLFPAFGPTREVARKQRIPWRRETVFNYEIKWIDYFLREAHAVEPMTESEIIARTKQSSIPKELGLWCDDLHVLDLWEAWHTKKRTPSRLMQGGYAGPGVEAVTEQVAEIADGSVQDPVAASVLGETALVENGEETEEDVQ